MPAIGVGLMPSTTGMRGTLIRTNVVLRGNILDNGGLPIISRGFHYGPTVAMGTTTTVSSLDNLFTLNLKLKSGDFYWQAFAINADGESVANIKYEIIP
jgi:hypothetical protein